MRAVSLDGSALWIAMKIVGSLSRLVRIGAGIKIRNKKNIYTNAFKQGKNINVIQYAAEKEYHLLHQSPVQNFASYILRALS